MRDAGSKDAGGSKDRGRHGAGREGRRHEGGDGVGDEPTRGMAPRGSELYVGLSKGQERARSEGQGVNGTVFKTKHSCVSVAGIHN